MTATGKGGIVEYVLAPLTVWTAVADGAITGGNMVQYSGDRKVKIASDAISLVAAGVALYNAADKDGNLAVAVDGVWPIVADGALAAGERVVVGGVDGSVKAIVAVDNTNAASVAVGVVATRAIVGYAMEAVADTAAGRVRLKL